LSEKELIKDLQSGSEPAFRTLVSTYQDKVFNTVLGFLQQPEEAQDVTQEVFVKIFQSIRNFRHESALGTWIYRIAVTQSLDQLRKNKRRKRGREILALFSRQEINESVFLHPGVVAEQKENSVMLFNAIKKLPENQKTAFLLQKVESLGQEEIAAIMKTTVSSVESLLHRAKQNLRKSLNAGYRENEK
jgi:RNA polymerase sigma factor (sigma-70 family)